MQPARILAIGVLVPAAVLAQRPSAAPVPSGSIGPLHHQIDTRVPEAQQSFDEGLTMYYGFNREGARRSFAAAAALDPKAAMPHVGLALSFGPNLNTESTPADVNAACTEGRRGATLARQADEHAYAEAMATRYCGGLSFDASTAYAIAMGTLFQKRPDDPDAATLYADSLQMLRPRTGEQNAELVAVLELVLRRWPDHPGATHYYIHAVEGSASPERGLASARRLETLVPAVGHLLHMPSHIYTRLGEYDRAIAANERAAAADRAYLQSHPGDEEQLTLYEHDSKSLAAALSSAGQFARARQVADTPLARPGHRANSTSHSSAFSALRPLVLLRFYKWADVVPSPLPLPGARALALHHFARAAASAQLKQWTLADVERRAFEREAAAAPVGAMFRSNRWRDVLQVFRLMLDARVAQGRGDTAAAIDAWRRATAAQDKLTYHEPAPIYYPVRESLGAALYRNRQYLDARRVFEEDLARTPGNGRSLFGLWKTLVALDRRPDAEAARRRFQDAWAASDVALSLDDY